MIDLPRGLTPTALAAVADLERRALALARGGTPDHSEHALQLLGDPVEGPSDPRVTVRPATDRDATDVAALLRTGFGWRPPDDPSATSRVPAGTLVVEVGGATVGTLWTERDGDTAGVFGFVVRPDHRGRGIGRDVLRRVCRRARADGAARVRLEVAVDNDHALGLYTSLGFTHVATEDYYALPVTANTAPDARPPAGPAR